MIIDENNNKPEITPEEIEAVENQLLKTEWVDEAKQIPLEELNPNERNIIIKCIEKQELSDNEKTTLKTVLNQYRGAIRKYNPEETIINAEKNITLVEDEKTFLKLIEEHEQTKELTMYYPFDDGTEAKLELIVLPITDSKTVLNITSNLGLFEDFTDKEIEIYNRDEQDEPVTREEKIIASKVREKLNQRLQDKQLEVMNEFLARQTRLKNNPDSDYLMMKKIYSSMGIAYRAMLFTRIQNLLHLNDEIEDEKVFRQFD